jgi:hypothetical protein
MLLTVSAAAVAQTPPAAQPGPTQSEPTQSEPTQSEPTQRDELEPGVNTSAPASAPPPAPADAPAAPADRPAANATPAPARAAKPAATTNKGKGNAKDRLELDASQITGNRELPKVLYIVPWRGAELGDLVGRPVNSLLDEVLEPVDRDVFRRQNRYFEALQPNEAAPASKPEK